MACVPVRVIGLHLLQRHRQFGEEKDKVMDMTQERPVEAWVEAAPCTRCGGWGGRRGSFRGGSSGNTNSPQANSEKGGDGKCRPCKGTGKVTVKVTPRCLKCLESS